MFKIDYVRGDDCEILTERETLEEAKKAAEEFQAEKIAQKKGGIITVYEMSTQRGFLMKKCYAFYHCGTREDA